MIYYANYENFVGAFFNKRGETMRIKLMNCI